MTTFIDTKHFTAFERVTSVRRASSGSVEVGVDDALLRVDVLRDGLIRLKITRTGEFDEQPTHAVHPDFQPQAVRFDLVEEGGCVKIATSRMAVVIDRDPFGISAYRADGSVIFETKLDEDENDTDEDRSPRKAFSYLNDEFLVTRSCRREDVILGLGEKTGRMNRKGRSFTLWNTDVLSPDAAGRFASRFDGSNPRSDQTSTEFDPYYISIPFYHHLSQETGNAAGFFIDNGYRGHFDFEQPYRYSFHFAGGQYTEYIFAGPSLRDILADYTELTGRIQAPPLWALGYHQCRWHKYTQEMVEQLAGKFRESAIPCDALWLDIEYMKGYRVFTWDEERFPDPQGLFKQLSADGFRTITIVDPGVKAEPGYSVYEEGLKRDAFCKTESGNIYIGQVWPGRTAFPDFTQAEARRWWGELNAKHVEFGLAGIWNDMNEPATGDIPEGAMRFGKNGCYSHERFHNQYALLMAMGTQEGLLSTMPNLRTFILSRAGSAGIQRYAANWMGDNMARWDHLWMSTPMALGLGLSGQPFVGADIGGFAEDSSPELFIRWMQCGALTPFCRNHNQANQTSQYPWSFGEAVQGLVRESLNLRYRLLPTLYSTFIASMETGMPVQRPLVLDYQSDATAREVDDQFLVGEHLLVAPVFTPGTTARHVYLPRGTWHSWHTGEIVAGPKFDLAQTPMENIPIYARGGSVIAMWPEAPPSTMGYQPASIELHLFIPEEDGEWQSLLQEDDGITFACQSGACYRTQFMVRRQGGYLSLKADTTGSGYSEFARQHFTVLFHGAPPSQVRVDDANAEIDGSAVRIPNTGQSFHLEARL